MGTMRHMNIGLVVGVVIVIAGVLAFKDSSEAAMQGMALVGMFGGLALGLWLDTRAKRSAGKHSQ